MGAHVIVTEVDPMRALEAAMDGFEVLPMAKAAEIGDVFCTATGDKGVITAEHMGRMKDGAILSNTGTSTSRSTSRAALARDRDAARPRVRRGVHDGGRPADLPHCRGPARQPQAPPRAIPALVMDMSFANQALGAEYAVQNAASLERKVYPVPDEIDREIARLKLATMGIDIDQLTEEQQKYLASWDEGT
jgi:adenosylhomocysteinase